jgi:protein gp37
MSRTGISYADMGWSFLVGCTPVSAGCTSCWARDLHTKRHRAWLNGWADAPKQYRKPFSEVQYFPQRLDEPLHWRKPQVVFVCPQADLFHETVSDETIEAAFGVMSFCGQHRFLVVTKRLDRAMEWFAGRTEGICQAEVIFRELELDTPKRKISLMRDCSTINNWPLKNVVVIASVENQMTADERIPKLLRIPAAIHMMSYEPALGPLDIDHIPTRGKLDGVLMGCESGANRRHTDDDWFRRVIADCQAAGVPCYLKQRCIGNTVVIEPELDGRKYLDLSWKLAKER